MATNILLAGLGLISGLLVARLLGPDGRGELAAIQTWPTLLATLSLLGTGDALPYFSAREPARAGRWLTTAISIALVACIPFALVGYVVMPWLLSAQNERVIYAARIYLCLLPIQAVVGMLQHPLRGRNDLIAWNLIRPLPNIVWVTILLFHMPLNANEPITISAHYLIGLTLLILPVGAFVRYRLQGPFNPSIEYVRPMLRFGLPSVLTTVPSVLNLRLDQMLMAAFLGPRILGLYVVGVAWSSAVLPLAQAVTATMLPRIVGAPIENQTPLLVESIRLGLIIVIPLGLLTALTAPLAIPLLFGAAYATAVPSAIILCLAGAITSFNQILATGAHSLGRPRFVLIAEVSGVVVTLGLLWLLLPSLQLIGAALSSLGSYMVVSIILLLFITRRTGLPIKTLMPDYDKIHSIFSMLLIKFRFWR